MHVYVYKNTSKSSWMSEDNATYGSSMNDKCELTVSISKSYEQLLIDIALCSNLIEPDAIAHCALRLTHDIANTPKSPPTNVFFKKKVHLR